MGPTAMQGISRFVMVLLVCAGLAAAQSTVLYKLLSSRTSGSSESVRESDYNVTVDQGLDVSSVKNIICMLIRNEKPAAYDVLNIGIYYKLDRFIPENDRDLKDVAEHREHRLAQYHWNKDSPKDSRRLVVTKDTKGQSLSDWRFYDFDHRKSCR